MKSPHPPAPRAILFVLLIPVLVAAIGCAVSTLRLVSREAVIKEDYVLVNSVRNGLLSVDVWKSHMQNIIGDSITNLQFRPEQQAALKIEIENILRAIMAQATTVMRQDQKTFHEKVRKIAFKALAPTLKKQTPEFAQSILDEIKKPGNLEKLKVLALSQLNTYIDQSHDNTAPAVSLQTILAKYNCKSQEEFNDKASALLTSLQKKIRWNISVMIASLFVYLLAWGLARHHQDLHTPLFVLSVILAFIVLFSSLSLPLIDIDARIKNVDFLVLGEHLKFNDQMLYYRSKSILQMVKVLIVSGKVDTILVGLLLFIFSIIFPISKLICAMASLLGGPSLRQNRLVHFFAYQSGKWSMADVFVVAIFISYIGFNSILNDQIKGLNATLDSWHIIATNETSLQPGFILFISFVLFGLALSEILKRVVHEKASIKEAEVA